MQRYPSPYPLPQGEGKQLRLRFGLVLLLVVSVFAHGAERRPGTIVTSDGVTLKGEVWFSTPEVKIYEGEDVSGGRFLRVAQDELASIVFSVKNSFTENEWRFKNAGSDEKEVTDRKYPVVDLKSETRLKSGQLLKGHLYTQPIFVRVQDRENPMDYDTKKFILKYQHKGEVGQEIKDIVYVKSITFDDVDATKSEGARGALTGAVKGLGKLEQVSAYGLKRGRAYEGKVDAAKGSFEIGNLPEDSYDVWALTDKGIYVSLSEKQFTPEEDRRPLEADDLKTLNAHLLKFRDFFDQQIALTLHGDRDAARTLVWQRRQAPLYDEEVLNGGQIYRLDMWPWHMRQTEWHIDASSRANMFRYFEKKNAAPRLIYRVQKWNDIALVAGERRTLELSEADLKDVKPFPLPEVFSNKTEGVKAGMKDEK